MKIKSLSIIFSFFMFIMANSQTCHSNIEISDTSCFNGLKIFNISNKYYRAGHFAMNSKGDMIIEYSYLQYRLFFGLKQNGQLYYPNVTKEIELTSDTIQNDTIRRYESTNLFVSLVNDLIKENEYLLSLSSWKTVLELHNLKSEEYSLLEATNFFEHTQGTYAYVFQVLEANYNNKNIYFCIYITLELNEREYYTENVIEIKRFGLTNFNFGFDLENKIQIRYNEITRITSSFIWDYYNILALFYLSNDERLYHLRLYDYELNQIYDNSITEQIEFGSNLYNGYFFKACYLYDQYAAFFYFRDRGLISFEILYLNKESESSYNFNKIITFQDNTFFLIYDITINDFVKIDNDRFALVSTISSAELNIILFDLYNEYQGLKARYYSYNLNSQIMSSLGNEISGFTYNGFLAFTATVLPTVPNSDRDNVFPIFLMFGYPNGTDTEIDIYLFLMDSDDYNQDNNLYNYLMKNMTIENNIFGYEKVQQIKLISIPDELIFLNGEDNSRITNNGAIDVNSILNQDDSKVKDDRYYYLEYQFIVKEPDYSSFYSNDYICNLKESGTLDISNYFVPKTLYGRINTLKFKLCHRYCGTCKKMGNTILNQKCESCLDQYSYINLDHPSECVPQGYFIDYENGSLEQCTSDNSKFYINNGKTIYIKDTYECPADYPYYDEESKECKNSPPYNPTTYLETGETTQEINDNPKTTIITTHEINDNPKTTIVTTTQKMNNNPKTTIINKTPTEKIKTEIPTNIETGKIKYSSQIIRKNFSFELNMTNNEIIDKIDKEILIDYQVGDESIEIKGENNTVFQLTTSDNEMKKFSGSMLNPNGLSVIDLGDCEDSLKTYYEIDDSYSLIIKKYEQVTISAERNVQYEVYHPITKQKLNLSVCDEDTVDLYIPVQIDEKTLKLYEDLQNSGYDLFNIEDPFYNDLCSPYKSENGTDVLLSDRKNDYYNNNHTTCQANCQYSSFNSEYQFLKCECKVIVDDIDINNFNKFSKKITKNFYDILKNSNYKTLKCYNLVFNASQLKKNIGSFVVIFFFVGYACFFSIYMIKGITPLQDEVIKTLTSKFKDVNITTIEKSLIVEKEKPKDEKVNDGKEAKATKKRRKSKLIEFPPKKRKTVVLENDMEVDDKKMKRRKSKKLTKTKIIQEERRKSRKENRLSIVDKKDILTETKKEMIENDDKKELKKRRKSKEKVYNDTNKVMSDKKMDDLDLNNLSYEKAVELDKRTLGQIYWSRLRGKHLLIFTFISCNDHNLVYIKIARFLFLICTSMAMNVIFFFDSSMHKIYMDYGKYNFIQQVPQIIYSSIVSLVIEMLIGMLSYTDKNIYEIRQMEEYNPEKVKKTVKAIRIKLIVFFVITFLFFAFYWYLISSFCAVYNNTQKIYLKDFATSFCLGLIYPFAIQLCFALLRIFTLRNKTKSRSFLYKFC